MTDIVVPSVGESISEVTIGEWLKKVGDVIAAEEPIVSLETDKVNVEVAAPQAGVLTHIVKPNGSTALVGEVIGKIEANLQAGASPSPAKAVTSTAAATVTQPSQPPTTTPPAPAASAGFVMPGAARMIEQHGLSGTQLQGTGPGGRIGKTDIQAALAQPNTTPPSKPVTAAVPNDGLTEVVPMSSMRKRIAERLVAAQHTAAMLTTFNEIDMSAVIQFRKQYQDEFVKRHGTKLGFMSFFVKACIDALREYPEMNAAIDGQNVVYHHYYDIGVAVGGERGLVVPVLRRAETLGFADIEKKIGDFGKRAQAGKITLDEMQGGTFTITNGGVYGSLMSTPIINPPQTGILGMHNIVERPIGIHGQIVLRPMMYVAVTYDHRLVDGRGAVLFLKRIKSCIEEPSRMLLEV